MQIIARQERKSKRVSDSVTVHEYPSADSDISGAVAEIKGRYPEQGYAVNKRIKETAYVISGSGTIAGKEGDARAIGAGDYISIAPCEPYAWQGKDLVLFISTTPAFDPEQHVLLD